MSNVNFFDVPSNNYDQEDLPWIKDWGKAVNNPETPLEVINCYSGDKGILIHTGEYKTFVFKREAVYAFLLEALDVWAKSNKPVKPLVCCFLGKKARYGLDEDGKEVIWNLDGNKYYSSRKEEPIKTKANKPTNPFLPDIPTQPETHDPGARRPKNAKSEA